MSIPPSVFAACLSSEEHRQLVILQSGPLVGDDSVAGHVTSVSARWKSHISTHSFHSAVSLDAMALYVIGHILTFELNVGQDRTRRAPAAHFALSVVGTSEDSPYATIGGRGCTL